MKTTQNLLLSAIALLSSFYSFGQKTSNPINIGTSDVLESKILNEKRIINIYLPQGYTANDTVTYPVIYIPDGGVEEDFIHLVGIVRFNNQPWIDRFPNSIVVGIENTNRRKDFTFPVKSTDFITKEGFSLEHFPQYGGSNNYIDFMEKELFPYIEKNYNGNKHRTIIGESLAGLLATSILVKQPDLFDNYLIISPSLWWGEQELLNAKNTKALQSIKKRKNIYVAAPNREEDIKMHNVAVSLYDKLKENKNLHVQFDYFPNELHSTVIHQAVYSGLQKLYPKTAYSK
ncbi:MAG: alpha/beta hydrolase [Flavobacteriaceae bacterium]|jgi:predicted alpha/beta superfamily hydrolase|nr:alpha/beta hydrolase [Flavobacteriaceae bacterium]